MCEFVCVCMCMDRIVCVCVCERERERERRMLFWIFASYFIIIEISNIKVETVLVCISNSSRKYTPPHPTAQL